MPCQMGIRQAVTRHAASPGRAEDTIMDLRTCFRSVVSHDEGQDLLEYALLVALIALVAVIAVTSAGTSVNQIFTSIANSLAAAA